MFKALLSLSMAATCPDRVARAIRPLVITLAVVASGAGCWAADDVGVDPAVAADGGVDAPAYTCGDHVCDPGESSTCPADCTTCDDHLCEIGVPATCPTQCATCGNLVCEIGERAMCPRDCATAGQVSAWTLSDD